MCTPGRPGFFVVETYLLPDIGLDVRLGLEFDTITGLFDTVDRIVADPRRYPAGHVAMRLQLRHERQSMGLGQGVTLCNAEIRHLRRTRLLYLRLKQPLRLSSLDPIQDAFILLAAYPVSPTDHALLTFLRDNLLQRRFLQALRAGEGSDTVRELILDLLTRLQPQWDRGT